MTRAPYYPAQTQSGETYVVDGRFNPPRIVSTVACSFDTTERWHIATLRARRFNDDHLSAIYARRRLRVTVVLAILVLLAAVEIGTGALSALAESVITATR